MGHATPTLGTFASAVSHLGSHQLHITGFKPNTIKVKEYPPVTGMIPHIFLSYSSLTARPIVAVWEVGMGHMINDCLWRHYMPRKNGLVFVVDSVDHNRLGEARSFLNLWHNDRAPKGLPLLICANKQDLPDALSVSELIDRLGLKDLHGRPWHIKVNRSFRILVTL